MKQSLITLLATDANIDANARIQTAGTINAVMVDDYLSAGPALVVVGSDVAADFVLRPTKQGAGSVEYVNGVAGLSMGGNTATNPVWTFDVGALLNADPEYPEILSILSSQGYNSAVVKGALMLNFQQNTATELNVQIVTPDTAATAFGRLNILTPAVSPHVVSGYVVTIPYCIQVTLPGPVPSWVVTATFTGVTAGYTSIASPVTTVAGQ